MNKLIGTVFATLSALLTSHTVLHTYPQARQASKRNEPGFADEGEWEASDILGMTVNTGGGEAFGEIADLLFDAGSDDLTAYVIERKGAGALLYAVQWDPVLIDTELEVILLPYSAEQLDDAEVFVFTP